MKNNIISLFIALGFFLLLGGTARSSENTSKQEVTVTGKILDAYTENALSGVTIQLRGTKTTATSQKDGTYSICVPTGSETLVLSFMGYQTLIIKINNRNKIDVSMSPEVDDPSGLW